MTLSCWLGFRIGAPPPLREWLCRENKTCQIGDMHKHLCNNNTNMFTCINACAGMQTGKHVSMYMHVCTKTQHTLLSLPVCLSSLGSREKPPLIGPVASPPVFLTRLIAPGRKRSSGGSKHSFRKRKDRRCSRLYFLRPPAVKGEMTGKSSGQHHTEITWMVNQFQQETT